MIYRKKPVKVEAEQFLPGQKPWPQGVFEIVDAGYFINTLEDRMRVTPGDYIITGVKGEKYACKPDIFELTYELE